MLLAVGPTPQVGALHIYNCGWLWPAFSGIAGTRKHAKAIVNDASHVLRAGPFGPDAYYSGTGKSMFSNGQHMGNFRNPYMEPFGGPFGADPYYTYGDHQSREGSTNRKTWGFAPK